MIKITNFQNENRDEITVSFDPWSLIKKSEITIKEKKT